MKFRTLNLAAAALLSAVCCTKSQSGTDPAEEKVPVKIRTDVVCVTKGENTPETIQTIDLFVDNLDDPNYSYTNTTFTRGTDGKWTPEVPMFWQKPTGERQRINVLAISPALETKGRTIYDDPIATLEIEQHQSADSRKSDYLIYNFSDNEYSEQRFTPDGMLELTFRHMMSKLRLEFSFGTEFNHDGIPSENPIGDLKIDGPSTRFSIRRAPSKGFEIIKDWSSEATIYPYEVQWRPAESKDKRCVAVYECFLIPDFTEINVSFTIDGVPFSWAPVSSYVSFHQNKVHTAQITVGKDEIAVKAFAAGDWNE